MHLSVAAKQSLSVAGLVALIAFLVVSLFFVLVGQTMDETHARVAEFIAHTLEAEVARTGTQRLEGPVLSLAGSHEDILALEVYDAADPPHRILSSPPGQGVGASLPVETTPQGTLLLQRNMQGRPAHFVQVPLRIDGAVAGSIAVTLGLDRLEARRQQALVTISGVVAGLAGALIGVYWVITNRLLGDRLAGFAQACLAISRGDYSARVPTSSGPGGPDELSATAEAFNAMCARIEAQTQELEHHILRLQEMDRLKQDFFSMVTHDLKSPLATIKGVTSGLSMSGDGMGEDCREMVGLIEAEADRLTELVNNTLDMSRLEAGAMPLDLEECHLLDVVEASVREFRHNPDHSARRIDVQVPADLPAVMADYDQLRRVVVNLLTNAAKFSEPDTEIRVRAREQDPAGAVLEVEDRGVGIPPDEQQEVFEKFYRGRQQPGTYRKGSGLGLAICKAIVEAHSGTIAVESARGQGSTFRVTLPPEPAGTPVRFT